MTQAIKKILLGAALIVGLGGYVQWSSTQNQTAAAQTTDTAATTSTNPATTQPIAITTTGTTNNTSQDDDSNTNDEGTAEPATTPASTPTPVATSQPTQTGQYKNGTYSGSVASTNYGDVQVSAVISGGKLADVTFLTYPSDRGHSAQISTYAMPILKSEAISTQSANVDIVSGATQISEGFQSSLSDALASAHV